MHVDLDAFFVAVEQARDPELHGKPVIVGGGPSMEARSRADDGGTGEQASVAATTSELPRMAGEAVRRQVRKELGLAASVGVAGGKTVAKVASDAAKPDG